MTRPFIWRWKNGRYSKVWWKTSLSCLC